MPRSRMVCTAVLVSLSDFDCDGGLPIRVGDKFFTRAGVAFAVQSFKKMRFETVRKPRKAK